MVWLEVETKIKLDDSEVSQLRDKIKKIAKFTKGGKKVDDYFAIRRKIRSIYPKKAFRVRAMKDEFEVNFKKWMKKLWTHDIVVKQEFEFKLKGKDEVADLLALFRDLGFREWVQKTKWNETYAYNKDKRLSIEINKVKHLGYFIEMEYLCKENELEKARIRIREAMNVLGIKQEQIDNTGYTRMLWYKGVFDKRYFID
jgi:adenylate cyclase, class 2